MNTVTHTQLFVVDRSIDFSFSVNFAINDSFLVQYDGTDFSIPSSSEMCWNSDKSQCDAYERLDLQELVKELELPRGLQAIYEDFVDVVY